MIGTVAVCLGVAGGLTALGAYLAPRVLPNLEAEVVPTDSAQRLVSGDDAAQVVAPAGWIVQRPWGAADAVVLRSPDGVATIELRIDPDAAAAAFDARAAALPAEGATAPTTELLASGLEARHAEADDDGLLVAAVGAASAPSVTALVRVPDGAVDAYRPSIARILETIEVGG